MTSPPNDDFAREVRSNQTRLSSALRPAYDVVVCGAGSSGCVVARRLAENPDVHVLLVEAGGVDDTPAVTDPAMWPANIGGELDWGFTSEPNPHLEGRRQIVAMGKVLGGGSSINAMSWSRGHRDDWERFAAESRNPAWNYQAVLDIYRRIEDWQGTPHPLRGTGGEVFVQTARDPHPVASAMLAATASMGLPTFEDANGRLMEAQGGAALGDLLIRDDKRVSIFRSYTYPYMDRPNLTVLTNAVVRRLLVQGTSVTGVEIEYQDDVHRITAKAEVVLSLGAVHTPKVLMLSGIGDAEHLRAVGVPVARHSPGVGRNLQDHTAFDSVWESGDDFGEWSNNGSEAVAYLRSPDSAADGPDIFVWQAEAPLSTPENATRFDLPDTGWTMFSAIAHPRSRGRVSLSGPGPRDPARVDLGALSAREDLETALSCVRLSREIANAKPLRPHVKREVMPGNLSGKDLEAFVRRAARTYFHTCGTAKMGHDDMSVVDGELKVHGVEGLRIADASIMPRITTSNTMAPCVVIGERAAAELKTHHGM